MKRLFASRREYLSPRRKARKRTVSDPLGERGCAPKKPHLSFSRESGNIARHEQIDIAPETLYEKCEPYASER
jgi:hypothetical protein